MCIIGPMQYIADLHLHSRYSRAVSKDMILPIMAQWGVKKGIDILATGDFTHPLWIRELRSELDEVSEGLYKLRDPVAKQEEKEPLFLLTVEISSIYSEKGKLRRIHNLLFVPSFEVAEKINEELRRQGCNLSADGRPIIGLSSRNLLELVLAIDKRVILIPCHVWTPHFGMYGSASGYDSIMECFGNLHKYIYGIETGLSSDPTMNWQLSELNNRAILSFSDAHSPAKMGREATVFEIDKMKDTISYMDLGKAIASPIKGVVDKSAYIAYTIEFYPEEGKYHYTGHRNCNVVLSPEESKAKGPLCPVCKKRLTEGVLYRVEQLAGETFDLSEKVSFDQKEVRWLEKHTDKRPPFVKLVPLLEIIAESLESTVSSGKVRSLYDMLCESLDSEISVLLTIPIESIASLAGEKVAEGIAKVRRGTITVNPGYDGVYGKVNIWEEKKDVKENISVVKQ